MRFPGVSDDLEKIGFQDPRLVVGLGLNVDYHGDQHGRGGHEAPHAGKQPPPRNPPLAKGFWSRSENGPKARSFPAVSGIARAFRIGSWPSGF